MICVIVQLQVIEESRRLEVRYLALRNVSLLTETVVPPRKISSLRWVGG